MNRLAHPRLGRIVLFWLLALAGGTPAAAQGGSLRGTVKSRDGAPISGANVFVIETLEGALTDSAGRFSFNVSAPRPFTLLVKRIGFAEVRREVTAADPGELAVVLERGATTLAPITVQAGTWTAGEERGATLTPLEVVTTPGTAADINRAIQLLPGVQAVDDGTALFVRGGDYTETKVFLNDALLLNPAQLLTPTGTFVGTVDPFQLDGIFFSSGGFGARYGNALSGVVGLRTRGSAPANSATVTVGLAALSADLAVRPAEPLTLRFAANHTDLDPFFKVNRNPRGFSPSPNGHDLSFSTTWTHGLNGEVKAFVIDQTNIVGVPVDDPSFTGTFNSDVGSRLGVVTWKDVRGALSFLTSVSAGSLRRREDFGSFRFSGNQGQRQVFGQAAFDAGAGTVVRLGGELERVNSKISGTLPASSADRAPGSRTTLFSLDAPGTRVGAFVESELRPVDRLKVVPGVRLDHSTLTSQLTADPRLSVAWQLNTLVTFTGAMGIYHQVPDPLFFNDSVGHPGLPPMHSRQWVLGVQVGESGPVMARVEAYGKRYRDLAIPDRDHKVVDGAEGTSRGVDLFFKGSLPFGLTTRSILSYLVATRTDADTRTSARAPFDVTWSRSLIVERAFANGARVGLTWRQSTGRPYTPIASATRDPIRDIFSPRYGAPYSERFPDINRLDVSVSRYRPISPTTQVVWFVSLSNLLDSQNTQSWTYSRDYSTKTPVRSIFSRSIYFGASLMKR